MPCPFLSMLNKNYVKNYASTLINLYGSQCPVVSRFFSSTGTEVGNNDLQSNEASAETVTQKMGCPFLKEVKSAVKEVKEDDTIEAGSSESENDTFAYNQFFRQQILKKKVEHSYRIFKKVNRLAGPGEFPTALEYSYGEKPITVWCSNDYLGMSCHSEVKNAARLALEKFGTGAGGTRNISGNSTLHEQLEKTLANLHKKEAALLFTSCFIANESSLSTLAKALPGCHIFSDAGNHASMIHGIRNSRAPKHIFKHNNPKHLEELLKTLNKNIPKIVAFETVHSMTGAVCPLEELCDIAHKYGALTFVDEVHAVGLYGEHGAGIGERDRVLHKMDMISGTLGKAFGNIGGYIAGNAMLIDVLRSYAAGFIFTTSLPPAVLAGTLKALEILVSDEGRSLRDKHQENVKYLRNALLLSGFPVEHTPSHIIPIKIGDAKKCAAVSDTLMREKGHYVQAINYPTVPKGEEKLRLAPTPYHTKELMDKLVDDFNKVWQELKLPYTGLQCGKECHFCHQPILFEINEARDYKNCTREFIRCNIYNCPQLLDVSV